MSYRSKVAIVYLLGFFVDLINMFIANVAYPAIGQAMAASVSQLAWVSNGYILGLTLVIPLSAWLAQRIGGRRVFLLSLALFMLATLGAGNADSIGALIGWRRRCHRRWAAGSSIGWTGAGCFSPTCRWRPWPWRWRRCGYVRKRRRRRANRSTRQDY